MCYADYIIVAGKRLIIEHISGKIDNDLILELKSRESHDKNYNWTYNVIVDFRGAEFLMNMENIGNLVNNIRNNKLIKGQRNIAFLTETPDQVVIATLIKQLKKELPINVSIVSTLDRALDRVELLKDDKQLIEYNLDLMRNQSEKILKKTNK